MSKIIMSAQKRLQKYEKSHAEIILHVRQHFDVRESTENMNEIIPSGRADCSYNRGKQKDCIDG